MTLSIRPATHSDETEVIALWQACGLVSDANDPALEFRFAVDNAASVILLGVQDGVIVGSVMVGHDGHRGWMYYVATSPSVRGLGFGRDLVGAAEAWLRERGIVKAQLLVTEANRGVMPFYSGLGYEVSPRIVMSKRLD